MDTHGDGLRDAARYPLFSALGSRRTRRVSRGTSFPGAGGHESANAPAPLTPLEEAVLITATGASGVILHDGPQATHEGVLEYGTHLLHIVGRTASNIDNSHATSFFMINDEGTWLIKQRPDREALEFFARVPRNWAEWSEENWLEAANAVKVKLHDGRLDFPREFPFYAFWNKQLSNRPGTTIFVPVVDCTRQYINVLLTLLSEEYGQRPLFVDDFRPFKPRSLLDWGAWLAMHVRAIEKIPYQPIGGVKRVKSGFVNPEKLVPLGYAGAMRTDYEAHFLMQNLMLVGEAMGLGTWIHAAIMPPFILERDESEGRYGLGFRQHGDRTFRRWPPLPASQKNYVGIDGVLEGLCPPYVSSMDEAVDRVVQEKYEAYDDDQVFRRPYRSSDDADTFRQGTRRLTDEAIAYTKEICNYLYDTYGRFPAHVDAFVAPGVWVQFSHLELEYYDKIAEPWYYERQARHDELWHQ